MLTFSRGHDPRHESETMRVMSSHVERAVIEDVVIINERQIDVAVISLSSSIWNEDKMS